MTTSDDGLTVEKIRKAVEILKQGNITPRDGFKYYLDPNKWYTYDDIVVNPQIEYQDLEMQKKFKEIDERIKREWPK